MAGLGQMFLGGDALELMPAQVQQFNEIVLRANPDGSTVRLHDVARRLGASMPEIRAEFADLDAVGDAWLEIRMEPVNAHTEAGQPTVPRAPRPAAMGYRQDIGRSLAMP